MERTKKAKHSAPTVLACDPSFTAWGYVVMCGDMIMDVGCIKTAPEAKKRRIREGDDRVRRTSILAQSLISIIKMYSVNMIVSELPHGSQNARAAIMMGVVVGIVQTLSESLNIPIEWYSEGDAKKALLGKISASKLEIIKAVTAKYDIPLTRTKYIDEAVCDAAAIYHVAQQQSQLIKYLS